MDNLCRGEVAFAGRFHQDVIGNFYLFSHEQSAETAKFVSMMVRAQQGKDEWQSCSLMPKPSQIGMLPSAIVVSQCLVSDQYLSVNVQNLSEEVGSRRILIRFVGIGEREDAEYFALCNDPDTEVTAIFGGDAGDKRRIDPVHSKFTVKRRGDPFVVMEALVKLGSSGIAFDKDVKREEIYKINFSKNQTISS